MKVYIVADYREQFESSIEGDVNFNPHPGMSNILEVKQAFLSKGIDCDYYGGIPELIRSLQ